MNPTKWVKKDSGLSFNPYYYECSNGDLTLSLRPPYKTDPWSVRLTEHHAKVGHIVITAQTVHKSSFRLEADGPEDPERLEEAKAEAFRIMERFIQNNLNSWIEMQNRLKALNPIESEEEA